MEYLTSLKVRSASYPGSNIDACRPVSSMLTTRTLHKLRSYRVEVINDFMYAKVDAIMDHPAIEGKLVTLLTPVMQRR